MTLPNAIIAGVNKAGTTSLFHALAAHEDVLPSKVKETHFFDPLKYGENLPPIDRYAGFFDSAQTESVVLEATPGYFYGGERMAEAIDSTLPGVKIVVILREPGSRAYSWWRFCRSRLLLDRDCSFSDYLRRCAEMGDEPEKSRELVAWRGLTGGHYSRYLPAWQEVFGERLLVCFYDDLQRDPSLPLERIFAHLGLRSVDEPAWRRDNVTTDVGNRALQRWALEVNRRGERLWTHAPRVKAVMRRGYYFLNAARSQERMSGQDRQWLTDHYREEVARLVTLVRDEPRLPGWLARDTREST